jgi:hypothetical protein
MARNRRTMARCACEVQGALDFNDCPGAEIA